MSSEKHADPAEIPASLTDTYDIGETLGTGHFSKVKLGTDKKTGEKVAIKVRVCFVVCVCVCVCVCCANGGGIH